jgi:3-phosphoshikimate 1-carboxyvinyltransferase
MIQRFELIKNLRGELNLAGDKSISHRAVMFASLADGESVIHNCSESEDVTSTINCFSKMGCEFERYKNTVRVVGRGFKNLKAPATELDAGNSGTTTRLISGILAAQNYESSIIGDESLSKRPMKRITEPLKMMGAKLETSESGTLPMRIFPSDLVRPIEYTFQVASAQVKSAMILLAIHLEQQSVFIEPLPTRNHTELMLGLKTIPTENGMKIFASKKNYPVSQEFTVPSDISSAAFFIVAGLITENSEIIIRHVSLNPTRTGVITVLQQMGGNIEIMNEHEECGEKVGDLVVTSSQLTNIDIPQELIPNLIDEIPVLSIAGVFAKGMFRIANAKELRVKESDRIYSVCENFKRAGLTVNEFEDGFEVDGVVTDLHVEFETYFDHRIAMAFGVLSMRMKNGSSVKGFEHVGISNPKFITQLYGLSHNSSI